MPRPAEANAPVVDVIVCVSSSRLVHVTVVPVRISSAVGANLNALMPTTADLAAMAEKVDADVCVVPAAVSDFTPSKKAKGKISTREGGLTLDLEPTPKILDRFRKGTRKVLVGFKAEAGVTSAELKARAMALVKEADLDLVVANDISKVKGDTTSVTIFDRKGESDAFEGSKALAAERVWRAVLHGVRE